MKSFLIGLAITVIGGLILNSIEYIVSFGIWLLFVLKSIAIWFYDNIILFEVNIWILLLVIFIVYKLKIFIENKRIHRTIIKQEKPKSLLEIFEEFDDDTKKVFAYIMYCEEKNKECTKQSTSRHLKDTDISNLELDKILDYLIEEGFAKDYPNFMHPTTYSLSKYGSDIAVALVKNSKQKSKA